jgi:hypothetical protein
LVGREIAALVKEDLVPASCARPCVPVQRQVFEAFGLEIRFDKAERRIEISATISEAVAEAGL